MDEAKRIKFWATLAFALLGAGFTAALFLSSHYASADDFSSLRSDFKTLNVRVDDVAKKSEQHGAYLDDMREDLKYIRSAVDELRKK